MNINLTWGQLAEITKGRLIAGDSGAAINDFSTDSRNLKSGSVFWVIKGQNHDAHDFLPQAVAAGAAGIIVETGRSAGLKQKPGLILETPDTYKALHALSFYHRSQSRAKIAAVTGSNGKSTTKEMIRAVLSAKGRTCANKGNLNNQYGLPLSLLELSPQDEFAVFELGASQKGDILEIGTLARPDVGVITNVSAAHLEFFGNIETVYSTKTEIAACLNPGGTLIYNLDDTMLARLKKEWAGKAVTFGFSPGADIRIISGEGPLELEHNSKRHRLEIAPLRHNRLNAAAACAAGLALGLAWEEIGKGLLNFVPLPMRMQSETRGKSRFLLDAYNANPASVKAALNALLDSSNTKPLVAVLGDMKELGAYSKKYHAELGEYLAEIPVDKVFLAGPEIKPAYEAAIAKGAGIKVKYAPETSGWIKELREMAAEGGTYLIKASRAMGFEKIIEQL